MKILIVVSHPTQFEGPFYQYIERTHPGLLKVVFFDSSKFSNTYDEEMQVNMDYGIDIKSGYAFSVLPKKGVRSAVRQILKEIGADLIIVNGYARKAPFWSIIYGKLYGKSLALRLDTVEFTQPGVMRRSLKWVLYRIFNALFKNFLVTGTLSKQFLLRQGIPEERISIQSYVIDNAYFEKRANDELTQREVYRSQLNIAPGEYVILAVSKLCPREIPWNVIMVMNTLHQADQGIRLVMVGDGPSRGEVEEYCATNHIQNVSLAGYVQYRDLARYYALADLFVHAAIDEPWGVSVQEAMASHLPVITSDRVGAGIDLIRNGENGFVYTHDDLPQLVACITQAKKSLTRESIQKVNREILAQWSYATTLDTLISVGKAELKD